MTTFITICILVGLVMLYAIYDVFFTDYPHYDEHEADAHIHGNLVRRDE